MIEFWNPYAPLASRQRRLLGVGSVLALLLAWSLVAGKGAVTGPASLAGFELLSLAGNTPRFVRGPALGDWGKLPQDLKIVFSGALLSGLRRAAAGEKVALLLDRGQTAALATLPSAPQLEVVTRSPPLPVSVLCAIGNRLPAAGSGRGERLGERLGERQKIGRETGEESHRLAGVRQSLLRIARADRPGRRAQQHEGEDTMSSGLVELRRGGDDLPQ